MTNGPFSAFKALCFDVYGTLIDWETGIFDALQPLLARTSCAWTRAEALEAFVGVETELQTKHPDMLYATLLAHVYAALSTTLGAGVPADSDEARAFGHSLRTWQPFPDTVDALARLARHFRLVVLSNVDRESFAYTRALLERGGAFAFDRVITAQDVGAYKPSPANFEYMLRTVAEELGVGKAQVLVTAVSLFHDHVPANALGLASVWIAREGTVMGFDARATYTFKYATLGEFADDVEKHV